MITGLTLNIKNFNSYLDSGDINLDGRIILSGIDNNGISNGTGKSTILKALNLFLTDEYKDYTKSDIKTLTNVNAKRGGYVDITLRCYIDNTPFEANLNGKDYFKLTADEYLLNKFRQELTGSIMNQGLVDNIADFEKRSELDNYIDKFYNTKEIVTKLKDLETSTVSKIEESLIKAKEYYDLKIYSYNKLDNRISFLKENISKYEQYEGIDIKALNEANLLAQNKLKELTLDYYTEKSKCETAIRDLENKISKSKEQVDIAKRRDDYIRSQSIKNRNDYLNNLNNYIDRKVREYNNNKLNERPDEIASLEDLDKINEILGNIEFTYGATYKDIIKQTRDKESEVNKICNLVKPINVHFTEIIPEDKNAYYVAYNDKLELSCNLPKDLVLDLDNIKMAKVDTSYYDNQLKDIDVVTLTSDLERWKNYYNDILQKEVQYTKLYSEVNNYTYNINSYNTLMNYKEELKQCESNLSIANTDMLLAKAEVEKFEFRISELHKIIDNVCRYSGEELRTEFGTKLARISTILLEDIFGMKGTVSLDSNGTKTNFKFNEGIGDLSFKVLSGGQLQKIKICINLAMLLFFYKDRQYLFLDEVFQHLDNPSKQRLIQYIVKELKIKNVLLIQHDTLKFDGFRDLVVYRGKDLNSIVKEVIE